MDGIWFKSGLPDPDTVEIYGGEFFVVGLVCAPQESSNSPGLSPLDARGPSSPSWDIKCFQKLPNVPGDKISPDENHWFKEP